MSSSSCLGEAPAKGSKTFCASRIGERQSQSRQCSECELRWLAVLRPWLSHSSSSVQMASFAYFSEYYSCASQPSLGTMLAIMLGTRCEDLLRDRHNFDVSIRECAAVPLAGVLCAREV